MPGMDGTGALFQPFLDVAPADLPCLVMSYPRDNPASYEDLAELVLSKLPPKRPLVLVAESFSGPIALMLASRRLPAVRGVVLCASFATSPAGRVANKLLPLLARAMGRHAPPAGLLCHTLLGSGAPEELKGQLLRAVGSVNRTVLSDRLSSIATVNVTQEATLVDVPVLYLRATRDALVGASAVAVVTGAIPHAQVVEIDAPHLILQRAPTASSEAIERYCVGLTS